MKNKERYIATFVNGTTIDSEELRDEPMDIIAISDTEFHVLYNHKSYKATVISRDVQQKTYTLDIMGTEHTIQLKDDLDILVDEMGMNVAASAQTTEITAPMPGLILHIETQVGANIGEGDKLIILEAMKMENIIKSSRAGVIAKIHVEPGQRVDKNQLLITFE